MKLRIKLASTAVLATCLFGSAVAVAREPGESITLALENDVFTGSDNNYTNGFALSWVSADLDRYDDDPLVRRRARFWSFLPFVSDEGYKTYASWSVVQEMDTPIGGRTRGN